MNPMTRRGLGEVVYPDSDGKPLSDNTKQWSWIVLLFTNLECVFAGRDDDFVAQNLLWYPVEGSPAIRGNPDVLVVLGRPPGDRGSYKQWDEQGVPLTVVFEILTPGNTVDEMDAKFAFYEDYGVQDYYVYNPDTNYLRIYTRSRPCARPPNSEPNRPRSAPIWPRP